MKFWKRLSALLVLAALTAALGAPALAAPASAAPGLAGAAASSFSDVTDPTVGRNADILRFMGVVSGVGGNSFDPDGTLDRAQFCTMLIRVMGRESQVAGQLNRTIFTDVASNHWARGYINLAASPSDGTNLLIAGVGNGKFEPDRPIDFGQAVTILIRTLGYKDEEVGSVWPADHIAKAAELGLSAGVNVSSGAVTRAQAAQMFVNLLTCKTAGGQNYYDTLGSAQEGVILFGSNGNGAVRTSAGEFRLSAQLPATMEMKQGLLILRSKDEVAAFLPDSAGVDLTLSDKATEKYLKTDGATYTVAGDAKVFVPSEEGPAGALDDKAYAEFYKELAAGAQLTAYFTDGKVGALYLRYAGSGPSARGDAVVVTGQATEATFYQLTGGAAGMRILKDGSAITMEDVKPNDVVTYDAVTNTLTVSDLRIPTVYDGAEPSPRAPEKIRIAGLAQELEVLPCAVDALSQYRLGDAFTVLLTTQGKVAGVIPTTSAVKSTAVGIWNGSSVSVPVAGDVKALTFTVEGESSMQEGQLVTVSARTRKGASISRITSRTIPGDLDLETMTLGEYTVATNVAVYERYGTSGKAVEVKDLSALGVKVVPADKITVYSLNTSDMVDTLVLDNVTGNVYSYGILKEGVVGAGSLGNVEATNRTAIIVNSGNQDPADSSGPITGLAFTSGAFGGVAQANGKVVSLIYLTAVPKVSEEDFFTLNEVQYVSAGGRVYRLADQVECYNSTAKTWFTGDNAVEQAKAYGDSLTVYVDPEFNMVRVIAAN